MTRARESDGAPRHVLALDGLRAVAALSVLGYHAWLYTLPTVAASSRTGTTDLAWHELRLGLVLFFVLSGFLLYGPWVRAAREGRPGPRAAGYAVRRAARIVPAYWLALAGSIALLWPLSGTPGVRLPPADHLWLFAVFGQNFTSATLLKLDPPMWTLAIEVSFYIALPLLGWLALRSRRHGPWLVPVAFLVLGVVYNLVCSRVSGLPLSTTKILPAVAPYFALGMCGAWAAARRAPSRRTALLLLVVGLALVVADGWWSAWHATSGSHAVSLRIWRDDVGAAGFALVILACAAWPWRVLASRPAVWLGQVSYGVYLWHVPVLLVLRAHGLLPLAPVPAIAVALLPTLVIAAASWRFVERPLQARARRYSPSPAPVAPSRQCACASCSGVNTPDPSHHGHSTGTGSASAGRPSFEST